MGVLPLRRAEKETMDLPCNSESHHELELQPRTSNFM